jgi:lantibiotic leader peptide-processing serine protease
MSHRLARALAVALGAALTLAGSAGAANYVVLYKQHAVPADAGTSVALAGGALVHSYPEIGVAIATSDDPAFAATIARDRKVAGASSTDGFATRLDLDALEAGGPLPGELPNAPATDADTLSPLQWDMRQIHAPEAHAVTGGSPAVTVGDIDTGADFTHPDLAPNIDFGSSVSCEGGVPNQAPAAWRDDAGHGTHTAGTIAAPANGFGIVGTAPNVRLGIIDVADPAGFFFPEAVVCGFHWAATHRFDVTNNSYFVDPFLYNCKNDPVQRAIWTAVHRAVRFAMNEGVTVVASGGNSNQDMAHPPLGNECIRIPSEIEGVVTVTANGNLRQKAGYSNYGVGVVNLVAPGGDAAQITPEAPNGRVLSTWPSYLPCVRRVQETPPGGGTAVYCYLQGTSMAAPHVAGVAALLVSRFGDASDHNGAMRPGRVQAYLEQTADPQPCPPEPTTCYGGEGYNAWYGHGQVNAFRAVTHETGR